MGLGDEAKGRIEQTLGLTEMLGTAFGGDVSMYTPPEQCAADFVALLRRLGPGDNGSSLSL